MSFSLKSFVGHAEQMVDSDLEALVSLTSSAREAELAQALQDAVKHVVRVFGGHVGVSVSGHVGASPAPGDGISVAISHVAEIVPAEPAPELQAPPDEVPAEEQPAPPAPETEPPALPAAPGPADEIAPPSSQPEVPSSPSEVQAQRQVTVESTPDPDEHRTLMFGQQSQFEPPLSGQVPPPAIPPIFPGE